MVGGLKYGGIFEYEKRGYGGIDLIGISDAFGLAAREVVAYPY